MHIERRVFKLQEQINRLGEELLTCADLCAGIARDQNLGIVPRTLFLERPEAKGRGCLAIGLNPGKSSERERSFYCETGITYDSVKKYRTSIGNAPYFKRARTIIDQLGLNGPILWSNLAKCENPPEQKDLPPVQSMRHCAGRFLRRELELIPRDWPVLGIGWSAFFALAYLVPERTVIGIPHPTGGYRDFRKMVEDGELRKGLEARAAGALSAAEPGAVWLGRGEPR
jgi:hypothetical protein